MLEKEQEIKTYVGDIVSKRRKELGMEQSDIEDYTGVSVSTISRLENGKANITLDGLASILELLGLEIDIRIKQTV